MGKAIERATKRIREIEALAFGRRPNFIEVSWRERYRILVELRSMSRLAKEPHWRKVNKYDRLFAREAYYARRLPVVMLMGVTIKACPA